jgi:hypothetical protein
MVGLEHKYHIADGHYMYIEASGTGSNRSASIVSPEVEAGGNKCLQFFYHMFGQHIGSLNVLVTDEMNRTQLVWSLNGTQSNTWNMAHVNINETTSFSVS